MNSQVVQAEKKISDYLIPLTIFFLLITFIGFYYVHSKNEVNEALIEIAGLLAEPLWNYDTATTDRFLSVLSARAEYHEIQVFNAEEILISETSPKSLDAVDTFFSFIHLLNFRDFSSPIYKDDTELGAITIRWKDTSMYYYANACLVAILLYIIASLYGFVAKTNRSLKTNIDDLHGALEEVKKQKDYIENVFNVVPDGLITIDNQHNPVDWNHSFEEIVQSWAEQLNRDQQQLLDIFLQRLLEVVAVENDGEFALDIDNNNVRISYKSTSISGFGNLNRIVSLYDVTDVANMRRRLAQADKLESIGRLAAGIAHEINTPTQYVITNIDFLQEAFEDVSTVVTQIEEKITTTSTMPSEKDIEGVRNIFDEADWEYLKDEIPSALIQSAEGLHRIKAIVSAMKTFSHPSGTVAEMCDLNQAIDSTVTVAGNEWKYVADLELQLEPDLPMIPCFLDQFNQVVLNMIINGVHAIEEQLLRTGEPRGKISISTSSAEQFVEIAITDNGIGMSDEVKRKIFDPFFSTKAVNKGTGQGLAIANDIIVNKHRGTITLFSKEGRGTTFLIQLPYTLEENDTNN